MKTEIKITADGSNTLFVPGLNEHYHSTFGAVQESMHVFINAGLKSMKKDNIRIFEMGFGSGLNALLTYLNKDINRRIEYHSIELYPLELKLALELGYDNFLQLSPSDYENFRLMHTSPWNILSQITSDFSLKKINTSFNEFELTSTYDLVYFDAFAPNVQPELWTDEIFEKIYNSMNAGGIFVTYCAKGDVKRVLKQCGFIVERLSGPPGKLHMLRARKK